MKKSILSRSTPFLLFIIGIFSVGTIILSCSSKVKKDEVVIYLVRHAEKDLSDPLNANPELTSEGEARAQKLVEEMKGVKLEDVYSTVYTRNINTVQPLCNERGIEIQNYDAFEFSEMLDLMKTKKGKAFLICGHGDNLLPMVDYLGGTRPIESLAHTENDKIFKVKITDDTSIVELLVY
ncbi:MAG: 2,3-bisphosphoglycerate-dependent phosphoglycerate mutase [Crocinitomix sp.]|jgi:2,3-bisphosphoglycerate-dependent phosphoglycerate mutase